MNHRVDVEIDAGTAVVSDDEVHLVQDAVDTILKHEGYSSVDPALVTVLLTGDDKIRQLNRDFADDDHVTDVLSFESETADDFPVSSEVEEAHRTRIGDIAISIPQTRRQATEKSGSFDRELAMLAIHGTLHLLGYDHAEPEDEFIMFGKTDEALDEVMSAYHRLCRNSGAKS